MKVTLTGPSGRVGTHLLEPLRAAYELATFDRVACAEPNSFVGDLSAIEPLRAAMRGAEVAVHLAATSDEAPLIEALVEPNIIGIYNLLEAARLEGLRRVVFASSVQAVSRTPRAQGEPLGTEMMPHPSSIYGATKIWGEALGSLYHHRHGLEFIALRIGAFEPYDSPKLEHQGFRDIWLSPRDAVALFRAAIETPGLGYAIVNGTSKTERERLSLQSAREILGYEPQDSSADLK